VNATWALDRHVSRIIRGIYSARYGALGCWPLIRMIWLNGAMDGREVPAFFRLDGRGRLRAIPLADLPAPVGPILDPQRLEGLS
jgi:predicted dienelactone hydrolase